MELSNDRSDRQASRPLRFISLIVYLVLLAGALVLYHSIENLNTHVNALERKLESSVRSTPAQLPEADASSPESQAIKTLEQRTAALTQELQRLRASGELSSARLSEMESQVQAAGASLRELSDERAAATRIVEQYGRGVAFIQGWYTFLDEEGKPLRYSYTNENPLGGSDPHQKMPRVSGGGDGPVVRIYYSGTAFVVGDGQLVTNRHIAQPWWDDSEAESMIARGYKPRLDRFHAFFPHLKKPFDLKVEQVSTEADLALLRFDPRGNKIPVLPLETDVNAARGGEMVVLVGYPTGLEAILAKASNSGAVRSERESSDNYATALSLAAEDKIRPSTTHGHLGDIMPDKLVYDALTAVGGSGGPVFNSRGKVIAVNYGLLHQFGGASFGVPVHFASKMLSRKQMTTAAK